jgi:hypothetical protein
MRFAAYHREQGKPLASRKGACIIAQEFGIEKRWRTILNRANGGQSVQEAHESHQKLTPVEEITLANFLEESAIRGFPQTLRNVRQYANLIRRARLGSNCGDVGVHWAGRFLDRHHDTIQTIWSKPLDTQRAQAMNPEAKKQWFELLEQFVVKTGITPENLYGMDESGCPPSDQGTERVVTGRGTKVQHKQGGADRENVTALVTICADGTVLQPTIIFKGQNFMQKWRQDNVSKAS